MGHPRKNVHAPSKQKLKSYISSNNVVFQKINGLIEVWDNLEEDCKSQIIDSIETANNVNIITIEDAIHDFEDLAKWSNENDFLVQVEDILFCIPLIDKNAVE